MPPVVAVVGLSNAGKTRVAASLVTSLTRAGYGVVAVKHCHHGHDMDRDGSDTDRLFKAGAQTIIASSPDKISRIERRERDTPLKTILASVDAGADIVVVEGYKDSGVPKILVADNGVLPFQPDNLIAVVGGAAIESDVPTFGFDQVDALFEFVRSRIIEEPPPGIQVSLEVDGVPVPLKNYPTSALAAVVSGFVSSLNGVPDNPQTIHINVTLSG